MNSDSRYKLTSLDSSGLKTGQNKHDLKVFMWRDLDIHTVTVKLARSSRTLDPSKVKSSPLWRQQRPTAINCGQIKRQICFLSEGGYVAAFHN